MLHLDDPCWATYIGGYQIPYDASNAIGRLLDGSDTSATLEELGNELCHQGDLGSASYAAVPWLVEYIHRCPELDAWAVAHVLTVEFCRPFQRDSMPVELEADYNAAIVRLPDVVLSKSPAEWDDLQLRVAAAVLALASGNRWFARTYFELDRAILAEMIEAEFGSAEWDWP